MVRVKGEGELRGEHLRVERPRAVATAAAAARRRRASRRRRAKGARSRPQASRRRRRAAPRLALDLQPEADDVVLVRVLLGGSLAELPRVLSEARLTRVSS